MKIISLVACLGVALSLSSSVHAEDQKEIRCEGVYPWHLQGVATDGTNVFWTFTTVLVKTDLTGKFLAKDEIPRSGGHMGDLCCKDGKVFVGMNMGVAKGCRVGDEVWEYDASTLTLLKKYPTPETIFCNNGLEWYDGCFWIITSAPKHSLYNLVFKYTPDFKYQTTRFINSGWTNLGVQTICLAGDKMLFGCYGSDNDPEMPHKSCTLVVDAKNLPTGRQHPEFPSIVPCEKRVVCNTAEGMLVLNGRLWEAHGIRLHKNGEKAQKWSARLIPSSALADVLPQE